MIINHQPLSVTFGFHLGSSVLQRYAKSMLIYSIPMILGGVFASLFGFGVMPVFKDDETKNSEWMQKNSKLYKITGPAGAIIGVILLVGELTGLFG